MRLAGSTVVVTLVGAFVGGCCSAGGTSHHADSARTSPLIHREHEWVEAMRGHDYGALDQILAEDFRLTFIDLPGAPPEVTREMWLDNLRDMTFGPVEMEDMIVTMCGDNVATVRMRMTLRDWAVAGHPLPPAYDLTDVWVHRAGRWQALARISEPLGAPATMPGR